MTAKTVAMIMILLYNVRICQSRRYDNFTLYSTVPTDTEHLKFLQNLELKKYIDVIFWRRPYKLFEDVQLIVSPVDKALFAERTKHFNLKTDVIMHDVGKAFDQQLIKKYTRHKPSSFSWRNYHSLADINEWLSDLAARYPNVNMSSIGKSSEGREIYAISLRSYGNKEKVIVEGGIHGNEWIAVEFVTYLVNQLIVQNDKKNWQLHNLARKYDWYLIPVVNPDGYAYSQTEDRLWRKNRRVTEGGTGVDLNSNFENSFGKYGTSHDAKSEYYCGSYPFSEPESNALADFITDNRRNLRFYFSFHAYGQKLIIPFGDRVKHIDNYAEMENFGKQAIVRMYRMYGIKYGIGTTFDTLGLRISGNSASWVKKYYGVRYVFTFLLRDTGSYGHALPPSQIIPTCEETISGLTEIMVVKHRRMKLKLFDNRAQEFRADILILFCTVFIIFLLK